MGSLKYEEWEWEEAEKEFKRALELNPNYATTHHWYAVHLMSICRFDEAIKEIRLALELSPFSLPINRAAGHMFYFARKYDQAQEALKRTTEMNPNFPFSHVVLGLVYLQKSMYEEALSEFEREKQALLSSEMGWFQICLDPVIGITYARMGNLEETEKILGNIEYLDGIDYLKACFYFALGEDDKGFEYLEKAFVVKDAFMFNIKVDPMLDRVRPDPRYKEILRKMNLE
jgi:tetratricopeptide (TPR) repeat protein